MIDKLNIKEVNDDYEWDNFIFHSQNKNVFSHSICINFSKFDKKKFFIMKSNEIWASFHLFIKDNNIVQDYIYSPINMRSFNESNIPSIRYKKFQIIDKYQKFIFNNFKNGIIKLDHLSDDLRSFFWQNFEKGKNIYAVLDVRYTSILNLDIDQSKINLNNFSDSNCFKNFSRSAKQQFKYSLKYNFIFKEEFDLNFIREVFKKTLATQNKEIDCKLDDMLKLYKMLYKKKIIKMFIVYEKNIKKSYTLISLLNDHSIYVSGGLADRNNKDYSLFYNMVNVIIYLKDNNYKSFDLEGINSPNRGFWKEGFGGINKNYYTLSYNNV